MFKSLNKSISAPIVIIIIVALAVIVGGGILVYQYKFTPKESEITPTLPPKDETADWSTYRNEGYGYELKYPKDWEARDYTQEDCFPQNPCISSIGIHSPIPTDWMGVAIFDNPDILSVKDWLYKFRKLEELEKLEEFSLKEVEIGDTKGLRLTYLPPRPGAVTWQDAIYISKKGAVYKISLPGLPSPEIQETIDQMLSTFRFIGVEDETVDWKIYKNEEYGYEIKYPKNWYIYYDEDSSNVYFQKEKEEKIGFETQPFGPHSLAIKISVIENPSNLTAKEWAVEEISNGVTIGLEEEIIIGDIKGIKIVPTCEDIYCEYPIMYINKDLRIYRFGQQINGESDIFDQMLSTFRFMEEEKITIFSPAKGDIWKIGDTYQIRWKPSDPTEKVTIQLLDLQKRGIYQTVWSKEVSNNGVYLFTVSSDLYPIKYAQLYIENNLKGFSEGFSIISK